METTEEKITALCNTHTKYMKENLCGIHTLYDHD